MILVLVASWSIGNISYLFPNLGESDNQYGFMGRGGSLEIFDISIYFFLLVFFFIGILAFTLYIYKKYGMEVLSVPLLMIGFVILAGIMFLIAGAFSTEVVIMMTIIGVIAFALIADKKGWAKINIISVSIILLVGIPIIYRFYQVYSPGVIIEDTGERGISKIGQSGRELVEGATNLGGQNIGLLVIGMLLGTIAVIAAVPKLISFLSSNEEIEEEQTQIEQDISKSVDRAIRDLNKGKDIRSTIIRCYQKMCFILEDYGVIYDRYMTPREFEYNAVHNLNLSKETIDDLTSIFEEARYSSHSLKESQREAALENLKSLREEIR